MEVISAYGESNAISILSQYLNAGLRVTKGGRVSSCLRPVQYLNPLARLEV